MQKQQQEHENSLKSSNRIDLSITKQSEQHFEEILKTHYKAETAAASTTKWYYAMTAIPSILNDNNLHIQRYTFMFI